MHFFFVVEISIMWNHILQAPYVILKGCDVALTKPSTESMWCLMQLILTTNDVLIVVRFRIQKGKCHGVYLQRKYHLSKVKSQEYPFYYKRKKKIKAFSHLIDHKWICIWNCQLLIAIQFCKDLTQVWILIAYPPRVTNTLAINLPYFHKGCFWSQSNRLYDISKIHD